MCVSLTACGDKEKDEPTQEQTTVASSESNKTTKPKESKEDKSEKTEKKDTKEAIDEKAEKKSSNTGKKAENTTAKAIAPSPPAKSPQGTSSLKPVTGSTKTPRIQEIHSILIHSLCRAIEDEIFNKASAPALPSKKILKGEEIKVLADAIKGYKSVFTNGCFDILHPGHVYILNECRKQGELLIVGLNSDDSIKRLKGPTRPYHKFEDRANVLAALECVDYVIGFSEDTPKNLIEALTPNILIKGGDYTPETVVGADWVTSHGGKVVIIPLLEGHSTTAILNDKKA